MERIYSWLLIILLSMLLLVAMSNLVKTICIPVYILSAIHMNIIISYMLLYILSHFFLYQFLKLIYQSLHFTPETFAQHPEQFGQSITTEHHDNCFALPAITNHMTRPLCRTKRKKSLGARINFIRKQNQSTAALSSPFHSSSYLAG
jgi:hypothetical protein